MKNKNLYIIENALLNLGKNRDRNLLQGLMIFAVITATVIALSIFNTSGALVDEYKTRFGSEVRISPEMMPSNLPGITSEQALAFSQSEYLQFTDITSSLACRSDSLVAIDQSDGKNHLDSDGRRRFGGDIARATMRLYGGMFQDFDDKLRELTAGRMPETEGECIVSSAFAELNGLSAGSTIELISGLFDADGEIREVLIPLSVTGIYLDVTEEYSTPAHDAFRNRRNEILTTFETVINIQDVQNVQNTQNAQGDALSGVAIAATYYLKSPEMLEDFASEIRSKGLPPGYKVDTDRMGYDRMVTPMEGLKDISLTFLFIVLTLGAAIMVLLSAIAIRERKYEIGVLRAMGMKKKNVAMGLWVEIVALTCLCFLFGIIAGSLLSQPISDALLSGQQSAGASSVPVEASDLKPLSSIDISVSPLTALEIFGIAMLLASISGLISVAKITKYEPIKILMERN